jgi:heme exporter protein A
MPQTVGLAAHEISCQRGGSFLFRDVNFTLKPGDGLLVTGPNGAGKTSLLRQIAGLLPLAWGEFRLTGADAEVELPELCHYVGHLNALKSVLSVRENLAFWADYLGDGRANLDGALSAFGLEPLASFPAGILSAGQKRKLALSRLFAAPRPLWLLDEPHASLDQASVERLDAAIKDHLQDGGIVVMASHVAVKTKFAHELALGRERVA